MFLFLLKLTAFTFVTAIWTLVLFAYLFATRVDRNTIDDFLIVAFLIIVAVTLTGLILRFYFSRSSRNSVHYLIAIDTLIVNAASVAIFWLVPDMIALFEVFGDDLPRITKFAIILHPYLMLLPLTALLVLLFSVRAPHGQTLAVLLRLSHGLLILSSGMSIFYLGAMYAPMMCMCSVV